VKTALFCALLAAGAAWGQSAKEPAKEAPPAERPAKDRPPLNLKLDNAGSFARGAGLESPPAKGLPTLGGDARPIAPPPLSTQRSESGPFPKDTNPGR
jgi:hypothetical protein